VVMLLEGTTAEIRASAVSIEYGRVVSLTASMPSSRNLY